MDGVSAPRLPHLDGWRGLSLLFVLIGHFTFWSISIAPLGVDMFFVLSGRLMAELLIVRRQRLPHFVWRRVTRIWPALWTYVGLVSLGLGVSALWGDHRNVVTGALASLTFTQNYVSAIVSVPYFDHVWSLSVEEHCYLILALVALATRQRARPAAIAALALTGAAWASGWAQVLLLGHDRYYTYLQTDARAGSVLLPFALHLAARDPRVAARLARLRWLAPAAFAVGVTVFMLDWPGPWRFTLGTAALALAVATLDTAPAALRGWLTAAPLRWLGAMSFSIYLWQQPFLMLWRAGIAAPFCVAGAMLLGGWSYYRIEQPARRWLNARPPSRWRWRGPRPISI